MFEIRPPTVADEAAVAGKPSIAGDFIHDVDSHQSREGGPELDPSTLVTASPARPNTGLPAVWNSGVTASGMPSGNQSLGFCENPSMAEAMLGFEQIISYTPGNVAVVEDSPCPGNEYPSRSSYVGHDQAWLWGWNYHV
ncbi:hypothetical protein NW754_015364 [Fusarium falciforme]|nr:hypothetical protein NW754_015364 [Fusarium falciforme]